MSTFTCTNPRQRWSAMLAVGLVAFLIGCSSDETPEPSTSARAQPRSAVRIEFLLAADRIEASDNEYLGRRTFRALEKELGRSDLRPTDRVAIQSLFVPELLHHGENERALTTIAEMANFYRQAGLPDPPELLRLDLLVNLRLAEQQNCVTGHCEQSCIFPIERAGVHRRK